MEDKIFHVKEFKTLVDDEDLKRRGFTYDSAKNLGLEGEGYYFWIRGEKELWEKLEVLKKEEVKEITGEEKEKILEAFKKLEEEKMAGVGGLF